MVTDATSRRKSWLRADERRLALLALGVRIAVLVVTTALDLLLADYDTSKYLLPGTPPSSPAPPGHSAASSLNASNTMPAAGMAGEGAHVPGTIFAASSAAGPLRGWVVWDAVFFADISARGYVYEQYYAFFPLMPALASLVPTAFFAPLMLAVNAAASVAATVLLFRLGEAVTADRRLAAAAALLFVLNPATIFLAAPYTEALFAAANLYGLYCLYCKGRLLPAVAAVAVSCGLRSNGVVSAGYVGHYCLAAAVRAWPRSRVRAVGYAVLGPLVAAIAVAPLVLFQYSAYASFCHPEWTAQHASQMEAGLREAAGSMGGAGAGAAGGGEGTGYGWPRPWCASRLPYVYGFVQAQYWNVGFLRYWTLQQLPNFLLAGPVLMLSILGLAEYGRSHVRHLLTLALLPLGAAAPLPRDGGQEPGAGEEPRAASAGEPAGGLAERFEDKRSDPHGGSGTGGRGGATLRKRPVGTAQQRASEPFASSPAASGRPGPESRLGDQVQGYLSPRLAIFMFPWVFSLLVAVTSMHVQVATRFLLSSCPPLYWYMAHVWLRAVGADEGSRAWNGIAEEGRGRGEAAEGGGEGGGKGGGRSDGGGTGRGVGGEWVATALVRWCLVYGGLGCTLFINFMPWT
ncbi:hypothetical protein HYH03_014438 [Edaphochlamys debaryana]|uniref:GPI mannosyltransferase 2 n=1 Tax=Edaphochlamys debaryana TaxID=47281 RepID=A0A836BTK8_9CHLO|nr:hypothetical protein HYH03_014438 [Edaphochlamys debaryana]|eukprot:KAG2486939.1 hypothetical protein HYH03_014438 [Edaphochlamys debaryana]